MSTKTQETCRACPDVLGNNYYCCQECDPTYKQCDSCYWGSREDQSRHPHAMKRIGSTSSTGMAPMILFEHMTSSHEPNRYVYLSNITAALPESSLLEEKGIKSVFSLVQFETLHTPYKSMTSLYTGDDSNKPHFVNGLDVVVKHEKSGVLYYALNVADIANPANLETHKQYPMTAMDVFCRAAVFVKERLAEGNVLIHCEQGRRRSPTAFLAFLVSSGLRVHKALQYISSSYSGDEHDWGVNYAKHRSLWIDQLSLFEARHASLCDDFKLTHPKLIKAFHGKVWTEQDDKELKEAKKTAKQLSLENAKKRTLPQATSQNATPAPKKYKLAAAATMMPSRWANKK